MAIRPNCEKLVEENEQLKQRIHDLQSAQQQQQQAGIKHHEKLARENEQLKQHIEDLESAGQQQRQAHSNLKPGALHEAVEVDQHMTPLEAVYDRIVKLSDQDVLDGMKELTVKEKLHLYLAVSRLNREVNLTLLKRLEESCPGIMHIPLNQLNNMSLDLAQTSTGQDPTSDTPCQAPISTSQNFAKVQKFPADPQAIAPGTPNTPTFEMGKSSRKNHLSKIPQPHKPSAPFPVPQIPCRPQKVPQGGS